jgi:hypothetical protein
MLLMLEALDIFLTKLVVNHIRSDLVSIKAQNTIYDVFVLLKLFIAVHIN